MPMMLSLQHLRLETTSGHVLQFKPNEPIFVPDVAVSAARAKGCALAEGEDIELQDDVSRATVDFHGDLRKSLLFMAVKTILAKNDPKDFDGAGIPSTDAMTDLVGFTVAGSEIPEVFQLWHAVEEGGSDYTPHANAENVVNVMEANSQAELVAIGEELGMSKSSMKGMKTRELRKALLIKLSGYAPE